jgi:hypothetical protein
VSSDEGDRCPICDRPYFDHLADEWLCAGVDECEGCLVCICCCRCDEDTVRDDVALIEDVPTPKEQPRVMSRNHRHVNTYGAGRSS